MGRSPFRRWTGAVFDPGPGRRRGRFARGRFSTGVRFHEATALTRADVEALRETVRCRVLRWFHRHGLLEEHTAREMLAWEHAGGFSLDASIRIEAHDRAGLERLLRYCARPPFALERLEWQGSAAALPEASAATQDRGPGAL
ncbi:MAG: transposase, partial [Gemmatimonadota bacterium]